MRNAAFKQMQKFLFCFLFELGKLDSKKKFKWNQGVIDGLQHQPCPTVCAGFYITYAGHSFLAL